MKNGAFRQCEDLFERSESRSTVLKSRICSDRSVQRVLSWFFLSVDIERRKFSFFHFLRPFGLFLHILHATDNALTGADDLIAVYQTGGKEIDDYL